MPVVKIESLSMDVASKEQAYEFLKGLDLIMLLYENPLKRGGYKYSIEDQQPSPAVDIGMGGGVTGAAVFEKKPLVE